MARFMLRDRAQRPIAIVEAASRTAADLFGLRNVAGYGGWPQEIVEAVGRGELVELRESADGPLDPLEEAFRGIGLTPELAAEAARGHGSAASRPVSGPGKLREPAVRADRWSAPAERPAGTRLASSSAPADPAGPDSPALEAAFRAMGLSESAARAAARGRQS